MARMRKSVEELRQIAVQLRIDVIKELVEAGSGHSGGSLSSTDIMAALMFYEMNIYPEEPRHTERDYFVLSKGHVCPIYYAALARAGYFPVAELGTFRKLGSRLQGHPGVSTGLPGLELSTGSLGQGLSAAVGIALGLKKDDKPNRVYCLNGDGELDEGSIWEAVMAAGHYKLDNLCAIVDNNNLQIDGYIEDVMNLYPLPDKYIAFNWDVVECDGHNVEELIASFEKARRNKGKPTVIIAHTVKGKGVSFMEDIAGWHGKVPSLEQAKQALTELQQQQQEVGVWEGATEEFNPPVLAGE